MEDNNMGPVYFIALGPVTGSVIGILVSLFLPFLTLSMGITLGAGIGLMIGPVLFALFNKSDGDENHNQES